MTFRKPTAASLRPVAERLGLHVSDDFLLAAAEAVSGIGDLYRQMDSLPNAAVPRISRRTWTVPAPSDNPANAWVVRTDLRGKRDGPLSGKRIAVKDTVSVEGVPSRNGGAFPADYIPPRDATVVTRILDAGGEIVGKAACEFASISGGSHTAVSGVIPNPHNPLRSSGGSSSGAAVLVATGEADMAIGGDQGGSIRIPASYCGIVGMKPTFGLVPYTGIAGLEPSIDHCGPMTRSVADNAKLLAVLAGEDGLDFRQRGVVARQPYSAALDAGIAGLRIGLLQEGFAHAFSDPRVDDIVQSAASAFEDLGANVSPVSIPEFATGIAIWAGLTYDGGYLSMWMNHGLSIGESASDETMATAFGAWRDDPASQAATARMMMLFGAYSIENYKGTFYAKAQALRPAYRAAVDRAFSGFDLLLMPTTTTTAPLLPGAAPSPAEIASAAWNDMPNLCPFNVTGHPALSMPCGSIDGMPVGMMLAGRHFAETDIYRAAAAFEFAVMGQHAGVGGA